MKTLYNTACYKTKNNDCFLFQYLHMSDEKADEYITKLNEKLTKGEAIEWLDTSNIKYFYRHQQEEM